MLFGHRVTVLASLMDLDEIGLLFRTEMMIYQEYPTVKAATTGKEMALVTKARVCHASTATLGQSD